MDDHQNPQAKWDNMRKNIEKQTKELPPKERFAVNDLIFQKARKIMQLQSLSLIYDEYGNQLYEKTSDINNYITLKKSGSTFLMYQDDSKLVETKSKNDENNSDFISYGQIEDIHKDNVKYDLDIDSDFKEYNADRLYLKQERKERKNRIYNDGINGIRNYVDKEAKKDLVKINPSLVTMKI